VSLIVTISAEPKTSPRMSQPYAAQKLAGTPPIAVTAFNDHCAAGLMAAARAGGLRIPDQLSLVGYDNSRTASEIVLRHGSSSGKRQPRWPESGTREDRERRRPGVLTGPSSA
jgi:Periplasmic binding protein-like domain